MHEKNIWTQGEKFLYVTYFCVLQVQKIPFFFNNIWLTKTFSTVLTSNESFAGSTKAGLKFGFHINRHVRCHGFPVVSERGTGTQIRCIIIYLHAKNRFSARFFCFFTSDKRTKMPVSTVPIWGHHESWYPLWICAAQGLHADLLSIDINLHPFPTAPHRKIFCSSQLE